MSDYLYKRAGRRLVILDAATLAEVGFVEVPEKFTLADVEKFTAHLLKLAREKEVGPS